MWSRSAPPSSFSRTGNSGAARLPQDKIIADINRGLADIQEAQTIVVVPPTFRGVGQTGGFQMMVEDRASLGLEELQHAAMEITQAGNSQSNLQGLVSTLYVNNPQLYLDIDRAKAESLQVPLENVFGTLQAYLGSSFANLFNRFNQVFQCLRSGRQPISFGASGYKKSPRPQQDGRDGAPGYAARCPAGSGA